MTLLLALAAGFALAVAGCSENPVLPDSSADKQVGFQASDSRHGGAAIVVANRASGSISVIDANTAQLTGTYDLPQYAGDATPEPMYVNHSQRHQRVFVGDRANNRVVVFNSRTYEVEGTVPAGLGVFHMWTDRGGKQLWVNNDVDNTITVINTSTLAVAATIDIPADLVAMGGKPHDVAVSHRNRYAYVTVLGIEGPHDYLIQYETNSFTEVRRQPVGKDPHVSLGVNTNLYVPCQNSDQVLVFDPRSLDLVAEINAPGAHGATMARNGKRFYTTNLPGGGTGALYAIDTRNNEIAGDPVDTPYPVPHNLTTSPNGKKLFVTHSGGSSDKVTVYSLTGPDRHPVYFGEVTVGFNPFGIGVVE